MFSIPIGISITITSITTITTVTVIAIAIANTISKLISNMVGIAITISVMGVFAYGIKRRCYIDTDGDYFIWANIIIRDLKGMYMTKSSSDTENSREPAYVQRWKEHTTGFDRVQSVVFALQEPRTAGWIADEAHVSEPTTRDHLSRLVDLGILITDDTSRGQTYYPDPIYSRLTALRDLVTENTEVELAEQAAEIQRDIEEWKQEYGEDIPSDLRVTVANENLSAQEAHDRLNVAADWESANYYLSLLRDAIDHYDTYTARPPASA